jgi:hypothetical protein
VLPQFKKVVIGKDTAYKVKNFDSTVFYIHGLRPDKKFTGKDFGNRMLYPGEMAMVMIGEQGKEQSFILYAKGKIINNKDSSAFSPFTSIQDYELRVRTSYNGKMIDQLVFKTDIDRWMDFGYLGGVTIVWAGDLNNDKHLEIIFYHTYHHEGYAIYMLMASKESKGILKEINKNDYGW